MGNDTSVLSEYDIEDSYYAQVGPWTLHSATKKTGEGDSTPTVTVLSGKLKSYGQVSQEYQRAVESLKTLRHPSILKYLNSCVDGDNIFLIVEFVKPLSQSLNDQSELEICCGLQNVLHALDFIHSKASITHNNVSKDAVFVTRAGEWKLGLFDVSCRFSDLNQGFLDRVRSFRYDKSIPPEDEKSLVANKQLQTNNLIPSRDVYAFGQLVKETISKCVDSNVLDAEIFAELAAKQMQNVNPQSRGTVAALSSHKFFNQPLLVAQDFLAEIAIKTAAEKETFFRALAPLLYSTPESVVGAKLVHTLLSRMVVMNSSAQQHLLPHLLIPRNESLNQQGLFDVTNYRLYVLPVVSRIFAVRDASIRLILLQYFSYYVGLMDKDHLAENLLPELLLGIKDTDDAVVAATLRALADLVPILGGPTVIGGKRLKLFANGAPKFEPQLGAKILSVNRRKSSNAMAVVASSTASTLPVRLEPDGGEDQPDDGIQGETDEHWSDWEAEDDPSPLQSLELIKPVQVPVEEPKLSSSSVKRKPLVQLVENDLSALDIQVKSKEDEIDYFADMQPTITPSSVVVVEQTKLPPVSTTTVDFNLQPEEESADADGWNWDD